MIIDTHCHYNLDQLFGENGNEWQAHWQKAQAHGVTHSIVVGTTLSTSSRGVELCHSEPQLRATIGYHPYTVGEYFASHPDMTSDDFTTWIDGMKQLLENSKTKEQIVGIGETGLDYFRLDSTTAEGKKVIQLQQALLIEHIALADRYILPLILHVRDKGEAAYTDTLKLIRKYKKSNIPFILHCVSGPLEYIQQALSLGAYIGVAGNVTYKNAATIQEIVRTVPQDRILLETDAPYLPPHPHRGSICEPWMIQLTGQYLTDALQISLTQVYANSLQAFPKLHTP